MRKYDGREKFRARPTYPHGDLPSHCHGEFGTLPAVVFVAHRRRHENRGPHGETARAHMGGVMTLPWSRAAIVAAFVVAHQGQRGFICRREFKGTRSQYCVP
jgi:hypothetical protein